MRVQLNELMDPESGFLGREGLILRVDVLECCPWFEFADLETYTSGAPPHMLTLFLRIRAGPATRCKLILCHSYTDCFQTDDVNAAVFLSGYHMTPRLGKDSDEDR